MTTDTFERTPPQDIPAEQSVLGGMLLSKDAIADAIEILTPADFYKPAHTLVYEAITNLYNAGEPADAITIAAALSDAGNISKIGGATYLHTLIAAVPTAANTAYYARIVAERAVLRRVIEAGTRIVQLGYIGAGGGRDADDVVDLAQQAIYDVTEKRVSEDFAALAEMLQPTLDEIEAVGAQGGMMTGVPTGFTDLDKLLNGLHAGQLIIVAGRPGLGKALALDTPIPTPTGWTAMGEVKVGDQVLDVHGDPTTVTHAFDVLHGRDCYAVTFSDGATIVADAEHLWATQLLGPEYQPEVRTTAQIAETLREPGWPPRHPVAHDPYFRTFRDVQPVPSVPVRCITVEHHEHLYLAGPTAIPTHNSTAAMDFCRATSIKHNIASAIFSLEMSKIEIVMRLLSAEARVPLHVLRSGQLSDDDWTKLARRMGEISEAPLFVDDTPNMNLMEIRAKARRLKQRHDLKLIVVDYLQLMTSPKRTESRQQEVADLSRGLKLLAKEVECPVVAVSQLNRGPEQRQDKRPQLSDLRESGCMTEDTTILRADTGVPATFRDLLDNGCSGVSVWSVDEDRRMVAAPLVKVFPSGVKEVYRLTLASGRTVKASGNHPFMTFTGWRSLDSLTVRDRIATPRRLPPPASAGLGWSEHRIGLLAHLIGDGCVLARQPLHYTSEDPANLEFVDAAAKAEFGITARRVQQGNWQHSYLPSPTRLTHGRRNPISQWFVDLGIRDLRSWEKRLPDVMYSATDAEIRTFLRHLWATDGCVFVPLPEAKKSTARIYYATSSRVLADGVVHLLGRLGIATRLYTVPQRASDRSQYHVTIAGTPDARRFCAEVGVHGARSAAAAMFLAHTVTKVHNTNTDTLPQEVWDVVRAERTRVGLSERQFQALIGTNYCGSTLYKACPSRERLLRCAEALDSPLLRDLATDDIRWDSIVSIEPLGQQKVYDATVKETHNFVANGIIAHNSIEQDADVVILLHRDDYYDKESPRAGEADFIVAKHRNGPTDTVTVAAQLHLSRFVDMAI